MNRKFLKIFTLVLFTAFCIGCQNDNVTGGGTDTLLKGSRYNPENGNYSSSSGTPTNTITVTNNTDGTLQIKGKISASSGETKDINITVLGWESSSSSGNSMEYSLSKVENIQSSETVSSIRITWKKIQSTGKTQIIINIQYSGNYTHYSGNYSN